MHLQLSPGRRYTSAVSQQEAGVGMADPGVARADEAPEVVSVWRALVATHAVVSAALERDLGERHGLGVSEFEVLERLAEDAEHKFRVQELAESVHLSQSALSRMIGKLEQHGLVERSLCDLDRRGIYVCLTEAGRRRYAEALPTQRAVLAAMLDRGRRRGPAA
jgi:DNA-binding MarR family transcriptional regulator